MRLNGKRSLVIGLELIGVAVVAWLAWLGAVASLHAGGDLRPAAREKPLPSGRRVAILIFEGVEIIDFAGPYEVFGQAGYEVFTVAESTRPLTTAMGMTVVPQYSFATSPKPDVLVVPGGWIQSVSNRPPARAWVKQTAAATPLVLSVCNGAFILAEAGLLDGLEATTVAGAIDWLAAAAPKTRVVRDKRFVDNGQIVTSAGLSSGIDGALHLVERLDGKGAAQAVATNLEYNWDPGSKYVRAALADRYLVPATAFLRTQKHRVLSYEGTTDRWEGRWLVEGDAPPARLLADIQTTLAPSGPGPRHESVVVGTTVTDRKGVASQWRFADDRGRAWRGMARVEAAPGSGHQRLITLRVELGAG